VLTIEPDQTWKSDALSMYQRLLPTPFFEELLNREGIRQNNCIYTFPVVMWMILAQRLQPWLRWRR